MTSLQPSAMSSGTISFSSGQDRSTEASIAGGSSIGAGPGNLPPVAATTPREIFNALRLAVGISGPVDQFIVDIAVAANISPPAAGIRHGQAPAANVTVTTTNISLFGRLVRWFRGDNVDVRKTLFHQIHNFLMGFDPVRHFGGADDHGICDHYLDIKAKALQQLTEIYDEDAWLGNRSALEASDLMAMERLFTALEPGDIRRQMRHWLVTDGAECKLVEEHLAMQQEQELAERWHLEETRGILESSKLSTETLTALKAELSPAVLQSFRERHRTTRRIRIANVDGMTRSIRQARQHMSALEARCRKAREALASLEKIAAHIGVRLPQQAAPVDVADAPLQVSDIVLQTDDVKPKSCLKQDRAEELHGKPQRRVQFDIGVFAGDRNDS